MWDRARKFLLLALLLSFAPLKAQAQSGFIQVSGTIEDPQGFPYAGGSTTGATISAILVPSGGTSPTLNGKTFATSVGPIALSNDGSFTIALADNTVVLPSGTKWQFTVVGTSGLPWPIGRGSQAFNVTLQIHGNGLVQDISSQLSAAAPSLTNVCANSNLPDATACGSGGITGSVSPNFVPFSDAPNDLTDSAWEYGTHSAKSLSCSGGLSGTCEIDILGGSLSFYESQLSSTALCFNEGSGGSPICVQGNNDFSLGLGPDAKVDLSGNLTANTATLPLIAAPANPASGNAVVWVDSTANSLECKLSSGASCLSVINPPGTAGALPEFAAYDFYPNAGTFYARNNSTGAIDFSGTDAGAVIRSAIAAVPCSTYYLKLTTGTPLGLYTVNSLVNDTTGSYSLWPAIDIPSNAGTSGQYCKYTFIGEGVPSAIHGTTQTQGVILDITNTAIATAGGGTPQVGGFFSKADVGNSVGNVVEVDNIEVRLPDHTRGNTFHFLFWEADTGTFLNDIATWASSFDGSTPVAGSSGNYCFGGPRATHDPTYFRNNVAFGCDVGFDIPGEHNIGELNDAFENNYAAKIGFGEPPTYSGSSNLFSYGLEWTGFIDNWNVNGVAFGPSMEQGTHASFDGLVVEIRTSGAYARSQDFTETNTGYTSGIVTYTYALAGIDGGTGPVPSVHSANLWTTGGSGFLTLNSIAAVNLAHPTVSDNFTRPNSSLSCGGVWQPIGTTGICNIVSNAATSVSGSSTSQFWDGQVFNSDQASKVTVGGITANNLAGSAIRANSAGSYYRYVCSTSGGLRPQRAIQYFLTGAFVSTVAQTAANSGCSNGDTMELWGIGSTLIGFYNGVLDVQGVDTNLTAGAPGFAQGTASGSAPTITKFQGGSLPTVTGTDSLSNRPFFAPTYNTLTNCSSSASPAVCGSAAAGSVALPTGASPTLVVNSSAVTANSQITLTVDESLGTKLGVTCNTTLSTLLNPVVTARSPGVSFTFTINATIAVNPACVSYSIVN